MKELSETIFQFQENVYKTFSRSPSELIKLFHSGNLGNCERKTIMMIIISVTPSVCQCFLYNFNFDGSSFSVQFYCIFSFLLNLNFQCIANSGSYNFGRSSHFDCCFNTSLLLSCEIRN